MNHFFFVENEQTGARARIPITEGKMDFYRKHRDTPLQEYLRPMETAVSNVENWNGRDHCIFGLWESIRQNRKWGGVYRSVIDGADTIKIGIE